jgi:hypothetical protein
MIQVSSGRQIEAQSIKKTKNKKKVGQADIHTTTQNRGGAAERASIGRSERDRDRERARPQKQNKPKRTESSRSHTQPNEGGYGKKKKNKQRKTRSKQHAPRRQFIAFGRSFITSRRLTPPPLPHSLAPLCI